MALHGRARVKAARTQPANRNDRSGPHKAREEELGKAAAEVFTDAEMYEFVEKSGPKIKEVVKELRTNHSDMDKADQQDWLEKKVRDIRTQTKKELLGID